MVIGKLKGIIYEINGENFIHQFREGCCPNLCQDFDGKLLIEGGNYVINATKGILDRPKRLRLPHNMKG